MTISVSETLKTCSSCILPRLLSTTVLIGLSMPAFAQSTIDGGATEIVDGTLPDNGTRTSPWTVGGRLYIGEVGTGTLQIIEAGVVNSSIGRIGIQPGSDGTATVTGVGSTWTNSAELTVGYFGTGTLTVADGGAVSNTNGNIGAASGSTGTVTVTGAGSSWTNSGSLAVGNFGTGTLTIADGGAVSGTFGYIGSDVGGTGDSAGTVTVAGAGSTWTNSAWILVGYIGPGALTVADGGAVSNTDGIIGMFADGMGTATVTGAGSLWTNTSGIVVGYLGSGALTVADGGTVSVGPGGGAVFVATEVGAVGRLNVGAAAGDAAVAAGVLDAEVLVFGSGDGMLVFNHTETAYDFATAITGAGGVDVLAGTTSLSAISDYSGDTTVTGGTLLVNGQIVSDTYVSATGTLGGAGYLGQVHVGAGGTLAPGNSIGTASVASADFMSGSTLDIEVDSSGNSDSLVAAGDVTIAPGSTLAVGPETPGEDGSSYDWVNAYQIISAGSVSGAFDNLTDRFSLLDADLEYNLDNVVLYLTRNDIAFTTVATTGNQMAVAAPITAMTSSSPLYRAVVLAGPDSAPLALNMLSGEAHASAQTHLAQASRFALSAAGSRGDSAAGRLVWGTALGSWNLNTGDGNAATMNGALYGVFAGAPLWQDIGYEFGVMAGYTSTSFDIDDRNSSGKTNGMHGGFYGNARFDSVGLSFAGLYSSHDVNTTRRVSLAKLDETLSADYSARALSFSGEINYNHEFGTSLLQPFAQASYTHLTVDGFTETGGAAALSSSKSSFDLVSSTLGIRFAQEFSVGGTVVHATGTLGWQHMFGDTTPLSGLNFAGQPEFTIAGLPLARDTAILDLGAVTNIDDRSTLSIGYSGQLSNGAQSHKATLTYQATF